MKAYKIELLVVDNENIGEQEIRAALENTRNIYPEVKSMAAADIGNWSDDHPLNSKDTCDAEYGRLFSNVSNSLKMLEAWGTIAFKSRNFSKRFCADAYILTEVCWDSENMRVAYIMKSGQHIGSSFKMEEWLNFLEKEENND